MFDIGGILHGSMELLEYTLVSNLPRNFGEAESDTRAYIWSTKLVGVCVNILLLSIQRQGNIRILNHHHYHHHNQ